MPLLHQATEPGEEGTPIARQEYERRRLTHVDFLPAYARDLCKQACQDECSRVKINAAHDQVNRGEIQRFAKIFVERDIKNGAILEFSSFSGSFSYASAHTLLNELKPSQYRDFFSVRSQGQEVFMLDRFSPASDGPLGKAAATAWEKMAKIALATVVLEDVLSVCSFPVGDAVKQKAIATLLSKRDADPWEIANSLLVQNARYLEDLSLAGTIAPEILSTVAASKDALLSNRLASVVDDLQFTHAKKLDARSAASSAPTMREKSADVGAEHTTMRGNPKWEFYMAIHSACPDVPFDSSFRERHAALYRVYRNTAITLRECIDLVREGADAENRFVSEQTDLSVSLPSRSIGSPADITAMREVSSHVDDATESRLEQAYTITGTEAHWFERWKAGLDKSYRQLVERRLERVESGNFGDWRRLQGASALCELRFHRGEGQRIYFRFTGPNSIELVDAGSKGEQSQILVRLREG
jgi:putative addiction module killer protein